MIESLARFEQKACSPRAGAVTVLLMLLANLLWLSPTSAQPTITYLGTDTLLAVDARRKRIVEKLEGVGLVYGRDFVFNAISTDGNKARLVTLAAEVVRGRPTIIFAGSWDAANELKKNTTTIPIVFAARANLESPVFRLVDNLARPEGNLTGFTRYVNLIPKKLQVLKEAFPAARRIGFVYGISIRDDRRAEYEGAANKLGITLNWRKFELSDLSILANKLNELSDDAYLIAHDDFLIYNRAEYAAQIAKVKRPLIYPEEATDQGVLMHYVAIMDGEAKAAEYISKLLRGAKVRDLAVQDPQEFDFSVNITTLRRNGLTMSRDVLARARKVE